MSSTFTVVMTIILTTALLVFFRAFPFLVFSKKDPPAALKFIEKSLPPMIIAVLLAYCFKDIQFTASPHGAPNFIATATTIALHLWKKNPMVSIFGGTILYMILIRVM